jgi:NAD(P)-dependent dehydrogenase (short-subunit alcohol dehydrogenase family)
MGLKDKVAVVFGASAGVGRAYAWALAGEGANVIAAARSLGSTDGGEQNTLANVVRQGERLPGRIYAQVCDVAKEADIARTVGQAVANFGRLDVVINNAALMSMIDPFEVTGEVWDRMMEINAKAAYLAIRHAAQQMKRQGSGSIINITARAGDMATWKHRLLDGAMMYAVTKAALNRLTVFMAEELRPYGVAVNALSPGVVASDTALAHAPDLLERGGKPAAPEVLGPAMLYLAEQTAATLTGQILYTDDFGKTWPAP